MAQRAGDIANATYWTEARMVGGRASDDVEWCHEIYSAGLVPSCCHVFKNRWNTVNQVSTAIIHSIGAT